MCGNDQCHLLTTILRHQSTEAGEWTGDKEHQAHGALKQAEGKVQNAWGNVKEAGKETIDQRPANRTDDSVQAENEDDVRTRKAS
jgi:uncharacterized protein YjbJ (UPF0337 family)